MAMLIPLSQVEPAMIEQLLDAAFGPDRHARTAYRIREGMHWLEGLSFAALDDDAMLVGTIQCWPVALVDAEGRRHPLIMVGPVAVVPGLQGEGFGKALVAASLGAIDGGIDEGSLPLPQVLIGDQPYYGRWGFSATHTAGWQCPGPCDPARLLLRSYNAGILPVEGMLGPWTGNLASG